MNETQMIREQVSRAYTQALNASKGEPCCRSMPKGTLARRAAYDSVELAELPDEAVVNSFGCGNPLAFAEVRDGEVVLDLGCGAGLDVILAARKVSPTGRVIGVDMTEAMIAKANETIAAAGVSNAEIRKGIIEDLPVESNSVDWVVSNCVINLSAEKPKVFSEIARVLKPGGRMVVSDIIAEQLPQEILNDLRLFCSCISGALSEHDYRRGLESAGLTDVTVSKAVAMSASQLDELLVSDRSVGDRGCDCGGDRPTDRAGLAGACEGKVWSARISAKKVRGKTSVLDASQAVRKCTTELVAP